jgi:hypothetical protein
MHKTMANKLKTRKQNIVEFTKAIDRKVQNACNSFQKQHPKMLPVRQETDATTIFRTFAIHRQKHKRSLPKTS